MQQNTAPLSLSINIISSVVLLVFAVLLIGTYYRQELLPAAAVLGVTILLCYLYAPVSYELTRNQLRVFSRVHTKVFGPVLRCSAVAGKLPMGIRLWGNGGLFAGTGIFWNRKYGIFRAYVTRAKTEDLVLIETPSTKIIISPERPDRFLGSKGSV